MNAGLVTAAQRLVELVRPMLGQDPDQDEAIAAAERAIEDAAAPLAHYPAPATAWAYFVRAGRPAAMWVCIAVLAINGGVLPIARLYGVQIEALDWQGLSVFVGGLVLLGAQRSGDKRKGCAS